MKNSEPCKNCKIRHPGCHDRCVDYMEYKKHRAALNDFLRVNPADDVLARGAAELLKRRRKKK